MIARLFDGILARWPLAAALASAAMLAIAHAFETFGGLAPCLLCLRQREVYWAALTVGAVAVALDLWRKDPRLTRIADGLLALLFMVGVGVAVYHAGAEWKFWPGPAVCATGGAVQVDSLDALLRGEAIRMPRCDEAAWVFLGLSMAGWNAVISLALAAASALAALRRPA
ncbi:MAG: disulfide bond formation protein B [Pseudomonadota bacterium]